MSNESGREINLNLLEFDLLHLKEELVKLKKEVAEKNSKSSKGIFYFDVAHFGKQICILNRGWVVIGILSKEDNYYHLKDGYVIRRWGTNYGLGEIAENGPTKETVLDKITDFSFHEGQLIGKMKCLK